MSVGELADREERPAYIAFERRPVEDKPASIKAGQSVSVDVDFALVTPPYSRDCHEEKAETWLVKQEKNVRDGRVPVKFLEYWKESYKRWKEGLEPPVNGTDIRNWSAISPAQVKNLLAVDMRTIEDLAQCNDQGLRRLGMGGTELKNKAMAYLKGSNDTGVLVMENAEQKNKIRQLEGSLESLQEQMRLLTAQLDARNMQNQYQQAPELEIVSNDIIPEIEQKAPVVEIKQSELDTLKQEYETKFGKKPHHLMKEDGLRKKLAE
jgi:hypothetical protein